MVLDHHYKYDQGVHHTKFNVNIKSKNTFEQTHLFIGVLFLYRVSTNAFVTLGTLRLSSRKSTESTI